MTDPPDLTAAAAALTGPDADRVLGAAVGAVGATLEAWDVRSVHRRGRSSIAVVYEVRMRDSHGAARDRLLVAHASTRDVPDGAALLDVDGTLVHVWQFPHDPYLPGLPTAVNVAAASALLRRHGPHDVDRPGIRTRSYRPTRRAVVELRPDHDRPPALYCKLLGGRTPSRVRERTRGLAAAHNHLHDHGLPVPSVLASDPDGGRVVLAAVAGRTLRQILREGGRPPDPSRVAALLERLRTSSTPPGDNDPDGFADIARHVRVLQAALPHRSTDLERLGAAAAGVGGPRGTVHGDLHDGQLLLTSDGTINGLLDVDGAGEGFLAHDVGRLLAHVEAAGVTVPAAAERVAAWGTALRTALTDVAPPADIAAAAAGAWVGLATGPLRVASPTWEQEVEQRIDHALRWAASADR